MIKTKYFANETLIREEICFAANQAITSVKPGDNQVQLAPYGKFPNSAGLQVFTKQDAVNICNDFNKSANGIRAMGLPFYIGHPDHPAFKDIYRDTKAYGRIKSLQAHDSGLIANVRWSEEGKKLINDQAFHGHSVNWKMQKIGGEYHPISLKSVGFTNEPNIPVSPILVANETKKTPPDDGVPPWVRISNRQKRILELMAVIQKRHEHWTYDQVWAQMRRENPDIFDKPLTS